MLPTSHACHLCSPCLLNSLGTTPSSPESMTSSPDRSCSRHVCQEKNLCLILASLEGLWPTSRAPEPANGEHCERLQSAGHLETEHGCQEPPSIPLFITSTSRKAPQECILLPAREAGTVAIALVDTGASETFMSQECVQASGLMHCSQPRHQQGGSVI
jgi:hypothetical protein